MSMIGKKVPEFKAQAYRNGEFVEVSSDDLMGISSDDNLVGKWSVVCFYPADFTFVCPTELEDLQEVYDAELKALGVEVYSVSTDTHFVHAAWHAASAAIGKITYTMIGDPSHVITRGFDVLIEEDGMADRGTFIIDPDGVIQAVEITAGGMGRDASTLVPKIKAAQYMRNHPGEVCPAKWKDEGDETLTPGLDLVGKI